MVFTNQELPYPDLEKKTIGNYIHPVHQIQFYDRIDPRNICVTMASVDNIFIWSEQKVSSWGEELIFCTISTTDKSVKQRWILNFHFPFYNPTIYGQEWQISSKLWFEYFGSCEYFLQVTCPSKGMCLVLFVLISKQKLQICIIAIILVWSSMTYWRMTVHDVSSVIVTLQETRRGASDTSKTTGHVLTVFCNISVLLPPCYTLLTARSVMIRFVVFYRLGNFDTNMRWPKLWLW